MNIIWTDLIGLGDYGGAVFHAEIDGCYPEKMDGFARLSDVRVDGNIDRLVDFQIKNTDWGCKCVNGKCEWGKDGACLTCSDDCNYGQIYDVHFHGINVFGKQRLKSIIFGKDAQNKVKKVTFTNVRINDVVINSNNFTEFFDMNSYVEEVYASQTQCLVRVPVCHNSEKWFQDNTWIEDNADNSANNRSRCLQRAQEYADFCNLYVDEHAYAQFKWNYETVYPGDDTFAYGRIMRPAAIPPVVPTVVPIVGPSAIPKLVTCSSAAGNSMSISAKSGSYFVAVGPGKSSKWVISFDGKYRLNCFPGNPPSSAYPAADFTPDSASGGVCKTHGGTISNVGSMAGYGKFLKKCTFSY